MAPVIAKTLPMGTLIVAADKRVIELEIDNEPTPDANVVAALMVTAPVPNALLLPTINVPPVILVSPLYVLAPDKVKLPIPALVKPPLPKAIMPPAVPVPLLLIVKEPSVPSSPVLLDPPMAVMLPLMTIADPVIEIAPALPPLYFLSP